MSRKQARGSGIETVRVRSSYGVLLPLPLALVMKKDELLGGVDNCRRSL